MQRRWILVGILLVIAAAAAAVLYAAGEESGSAQPSRSDSTRITQLTAAELAAAKLDELPLAPASERVDLTAPPFSNPTKVTNPLFPISNLHSAILNGTVDDRSFKSETTLLPETRVIQWQGGRIEALVSQYVAYLDGRIEEVALDFYAQADDGSVWYLGEDVFNYNEEGLIADTEGTWLAGKEGPPAMIMPADPQVGDVYRPENIPGLVFEEVRIKAVDETVDGPPGRVDGAIIAEELHQDGAREDKTFAPGYGEFFTGSGGDVEALALAVPADKVPGSAPAELETLAAGADDVFDQAGTNDWKAASATVRTMTRAWKTLQAGELPPRLEPVTSSALRGLARAVADRDRVGARHAAIEVAQAGLDLQLLYRLPAEIDRARFELWARQLLVDATARDAGGVAGDLATLEWIRDRFAHTLDTIGLIRIDTHLGGLRTAVNDEDLEGAAAEARRLQDTLVGLGS